MRSKIILLFLGLSFSLLKGEIVVSFYPVNSLTFTQNQMWDFGLLNTDKLPVQSSIEVSVLKNGSFLIASSKLLNITLVKGSNTITYAQRASCIITYGAGEISASFRSTKILPSGDYALCVTIKNDIGQVIGYSCQEMSINTYTPPMLTYPLDNAILVSNTPNLTWIPVMPTGLGTVSYKLELWTGKGDNNFKVAGNLFETTTTTPSFQYHAKLPPLEIGKTYTWIVSAFLGETFLGSTQIWHFSIGNQDVYRMTSEEENSYRVIGDQTQNAEYSAISILKMSYNNIANDSILSYTIYPADYQDSAITELPEIILKSGINNIDINLSEIELFTEDQRYTLEISDGNLRKYYFNFIYSEL